MFFEAIQKPDVTMERLVGGDYYRVVHSDLGGGDGTTVISGIIKGVTFSFDVPGNLGEEETKALVALVAKGVEENVFLGPGVGPGVDTVQKGGRTVRA